MASIKAPVVLASSAGASRTILLTGSTDGIGKAAALELAKSPANELIIHGRDKARCEAVVQEIKGATGNDRITSVVADLSSLEDVRRMAEEVQDRYPTLNSLVLNAGRLMAQKELSKDGIEMSFAVNHFAHFLLTSLLIDRLAASGSPAMKSRVVATSSLCHAWEEMEWDDLNCEKRDFVMYDAYSQSKLANVLMTIELSRRLESAGMAVTSNSLEPGVVETKLLKVGGYSGCPPAQGARPLVYLAAHPDVEGVTGKYYSQSCQVEVPDSKARDAASQSRMWEISEKLCGTAFLPEQA